MRLNNKGWGLRIMLLFILFLFFLGFVIFLLVMKLNDTLNLNFKKNEEYFHDNNITLTFESLENKIRKSANNFITDYNMTTEQINLKLDTLLEYGYIDNLNDVRDYSNCQGYVLYEAENATPFIKCNNYQTLGYKE